MHVQFFLSYFFKPYKLDIKAFDFTCSHIYWLSPVWTFDTENILDVRR